MRKIDQLSRAAFKNKAAFSLSNTVCDGENVYLHGNHIIKRENDEIWATLAGWNTLLTRRRLQSVLPNLSITSSKGKVYVDSPITKDYVDTKEWFRVQ